MSAFGRRAVEAAAWPEPPLLAEVVEKVARTRIFETMIHNPGRR
jgi:hypothetical protein